MNEHEVSTLHVGDVVETKDPCSSCGSGAGVRVVDPGLVGLRLTLAGMSLEARELAEWVAEDGGPPCWVCPECGLFGIVRPARDHSRGCWETWAFGSGVIRA